MGQTVNLLDLWFYLLDDGPVRVAGQLFLGLLFLGLSLAGGWTCRGSVVDGTGCDECGGGCDEDCAPVF